MGDRITYVQGRPVVMPEEAVTGPTPTEAELDALQKEADNEKLYGGWEGGVVAGGAGIVDAATLGASGMVLRAGGGAETMREINQRHKALGIGGQIVGTVLGAPGAIAGKVAGGAVKKGAAAGAVSGFQQGVHELSLDEKPLTAERVVSVLGTNVLLGTGLGGVTAGAAKAAQLGLRRGNKLMQSVAQRAESGQMSGGVVDDLAAHQAAMESERVWLALETPSTRKVAEQAQRRLRYLADEPVGLAERPRALLDPLRRQIGAMRKALDEAPALEAKIAAEEISIAAKLRAQLKNVKVGKAAELASRDDTVAGKLSASQADPDPIQLGGKAARRFAEWSNIPLKKNGKILASPGEVGAFANALEAGEVAGMRRAALERLPGALERAQALEARVVAEDAARLAGVGKKPLLERMGGQMANAAGWGMMGGMLPGGPVGAAGAVLLSDLIGKAANLVGSRLARAVGVSAKGTSKAVGALLAGEKGAKMVPPVRDFLSGKAGAGAAKGGLTLAQAYRARAEEIRNLTMMGPKGDPIMRPDARMALGRKLAPIAALSPLLADQVETVTARKVEFLSKKLARRPDVAAISAGGPDTWMEGETEMRQWGRLAWAADNPDGVEQLLALGSITPEDAEAYREIYPERYRDLQMTIAQRLPELQKKLPYRQRLALSIFTGQPVDPSLDPAICAVLQGNFEFEEGTDGGTKPPDATADFGSVTVESPTPAQERSL